MKYKKVIKNFLWSLGYPFVLLHLGTRYFFATKKLKKYLKNPDDFLDEEKYETIFKITKSISYLLKIKTVDLFENKKITKKPQLLVSNHRSIVDSLIIFRFLYQTLGTDFVFIAKKELENQKYGKLLKLIDTIFVDRNDLRGIVDLINKEKEVIAKQKKSIVIFPEGTRNNNNELLDFKTSIFEVCYKTMCVIQPIILYNTEYFFEKRKEKKDVEIIMELLDNIQPNNYLSIDRQILAKNIQKNMQVKLDEIININNNENK